MRPCKNGLKWRRRRASLLYRCGQHGNGCAKSWQQHDRRNHETRRAGALRSSLCTGENSSVKIIAVRSPFVISADLPGTAQDGETCAAKCVPDSLCAESPLLCPAETDNLSHSATIGKLQEHELLERDNLFRSLVEAHGVRLHRFIIKNIGNTTDAEDLAQQAFMEAVRSYETFKGQSELSTWLYGIAMNLVRNHLSRAPHRRYEFSDESELFDLEGDVLSPAQAAEQAQHMRHLERAMAELPESMRDILLMVAVDELSYEDAAALLTVPVGTVRSRLSRARSALRAKLAARGVIFDF